VPYIVYEPKVEVCDRTIEVPVRDVCVEEFYTNIEVPTHHHAEKEVEICYVDKPYEVVKWETRDVEVPVETIVY